MKWKPYELPGFDADLQRRIITFDGWQTTYAWDPWGDEVINRWMKETSVNANDPEEALEKITANLPDVLQKTDEADTVDAMMNFLRGAHHRDLGGHTYGAASRLTDMSRNMDMRRTTARITRGESPLGSDEAGESTFNELARIWGGVYRKLIQLLSKNRKD